MRACGPTADLDYREQARSHKNPNTLLGGNVGASLLAIDWPGAVNAEYGLDGEAQERPSRPKTISSTAPQEMAASATLKAGQCQPAAWKSRKSMT